MSGQKARTKGKDGGIKQHSSARHRQGAGAESQQGDTLRLEQAVENPSAAAPTDLLALQGHHGNQAVSDMIQTKLRVGPAGDSYEQEADRVAGRALDRPVHGDGLQRQEEGGDTEIQATPLAASITPLAQRVDRADSRGRRPAPTARQSKAGFEASGAVEARLASLKGSGSPLPRELRADMESRFGTDFGAVRVHDDAESDELNETLRAKAFTYKTDIYFSSGQFDAASQEGRRLLAHELTHVVQQTGAGPRASSSAGSAERGRGIAQSTGGESTVQRETEQERLAREAAERRREQEAAQQAAPQEQMPPVPQVPLPPVGQVQQAGQQAGQQVGDQGDQQPPQQPVQQAGDQGGGQGAQPPVQQAGDQGGGQGAQPPVQQPGDQGGQQAGAGGPQGKQAGPELPEGVNPKDWEMLGTKQRAKVASQLEKGSNKETNRVKRAVHRRKAKRTLGKAKAERKGKAPGAGQVWKAGWGAFVKETIPAKLSTLSPTSTRRAQQRALANRQKSVGGKAAAPQPARSNIGTIEDYLKERKAAKAEQEDKAKAAAGPAEGGAGSGVAAGIEIGKLQSVVEQLKTRVDDLENKRNRQ